MVKATSQDHCQKIDIIKIMNQSTGTKNKKDIFYVVTRNGRRAWPKDYWTLYEAQKHADSLVNALKSFKDLKSASKVAIVETSDPNSIN